MYLLQIPSKSSKREQVESSKKRKAEAQKKKQAKVEEDFDSDSERYNEHEFLSKAA